MNKRTLFLAGRKGWTKSEIRLGRMLRNPEGDHQGGGGSGGGDNGGGNGGSGADSQSSGNNGGSAPDYSSFWNPEGGGQSGSPESGSAGNGGQPSSTQGQQQPQQNQQPQVVQDLQAALTGMNFDNLMSQETLQHFSEGNVDGFNQGMQAFGQNVARQTIQAMIGVMRHMRNDMRAEFESMMGNEFQGRDRFNDLVGAIPAAGDMNNPASKTIRDIYSQALSRTKGDKAAAIQQTKDVMRLQAETFGGSLDLNVAPRSQGDGHYNTPPKATNWLEELASTN